jgi:hypothetical protein
VTNGRSVDGEAADERLAALYDGEGMGGVRTMRARVIRELIDEIRRLRAEALKRTCDT